MYCSKNIRNTTFKIYDKYVERTINNENYITIEVEEC